MNTPSRRALPIHRTLTLTIAACALAAGPPAPVAAQQLAAPRTVLAATPAPAPPMSLTASDGAGLQLVSLSARAVIEDPLAFTELHLIFRNPESRVREGRFRITLPAGATISRFAMRAGDRWQEGEVVEQQAARVAYEDFLHRRQDPALLETEAGNEFSARVFPIPPAATKELIVSYAQELPRTAESYRLPLRGLPSLGRLSIRAVQAGQVTELDRRDFRPDRDFEVSHAGVNGRVGLRNGNLVVARVVPVADSAGRDDVGSLLVLVDTSASRALGLGDEIAAIKGLLSEVRDADPLLTIAAFDQDVAPIFSGRASAMGDVVRQRLIQRRALGASNLDRALRWAAETLAPTSSRRARVLLVTDGVATAGDATARTLRQRVKALGSVGVQRLDVLAVGGIREDALLTQLVTGGLARDGVVLDASQGAAVLARRMSRTTRSGLQVAVDGAGWVWPNVINGVQPGDQMLVYADLPAGKPLHITVGGRPLALAGALASVERPLLQRAWVRARIARLLDLNDRDQGPGASDPDMKDVLKKQAIALSIEHRVLCPFTSLLVLETEQDYARFGIVRRSLTDILTVDAHGIALLHRTEVSPAAIATTPMTPQPKNQADGQSLSATAQPAAIGQRDREPPREEQAKKTERAPRPGSAIDDRVDGRGEGGGGVGRVARDVAMPAPMMAMPAAPPATVAAAATPAPSMAEPPARPRLSPRASERATADANVNVNGNVNVRISGARRGPLAPASVPDAPAFAAASVEPDALEGPFREIIDLVQRRAFAAALAKAWAWRARDAGDVLALVALGECGEGSGDRILATRAYGSIIDLFPGRADMRRFAGERLERVRTADALALAIDTYGKAVDQRPDHPAGHRLLAFALIAQGKPRDAFAALVAGLARPYPADRFAGVDRILREDLGLVAAAWTRAEPARAGEIRAQLDSAHGIAEVGPSVRFVLNWETDANDVDFHIHDGKGGHAYYGARDLPSGGSLYADVTTGYGPECFTIRGPAPQRAFPYRLQAHYYSRGPMGYGMGKLQIIEHDGQGKLSFDERPFVIMADRAFVDLGAYLGAQNKGTVTAR